MTLYNMIWANEETSQALIALRDALLPKLLSGEIRVGEVDRITEIQNATDDTEASALAALRA
jgi:hypothetical protein